MDNDNITDPNFRYPKDRIIDFNLEEAQKPGATFCTRDGRLVTILAFDSPTAQPVVGAVRGKDTVWQWHRDGRWWECCVPGPYPENDLCLVRQTTTLYAVQYVAHFPSGYIHLAAIGCVSKEAAEVSAANYKATIKDKGTPNCLWYSDVEVIAREVPV